MLTTAACCERSPGRKKPLLRSPRITAIACSWLTTNGTTRLGERILASGFASKSTEPQNGQRSVCAVAS